MLHETIAVDSSETTMLTIALKRSALLCLTLGLVGMSIGCNPRELTVSATDRVYVPSPKELAEQERKKASEAKSEAPKSLGPSSPETGAPIQTPKESLVPPPNESLAAGGPPPSEEVRVTEPPIQAPGAPQPSESSGAGTSSGESPLVAMATPGVAASSEGVGAATSDEGTNSRISLEDVYFDYDRFTIRGDAKPALEANAASLRSDSKLKVLIEGHCDERGTVEYNLVLGEKRARAARQYLQDLGIESSRVQITSLGKERPFCGEHNPACWQKNRRAHFVTQSR